MIFDKLKNIDYAVLIPTLINKPVGYYIIASIQDYPVLKSLGFTMSKMHKGLVERGLDANEIKRFRWMKREGDLVLVHSDSSGYVYEPEGCNFRSSMKKIRNYYWQNLNISR